jgi:hypothetical protein
MRFFLLGTVFGFLIGVAATVLYFAFKTLFAVHWKASLMESFSPRQQTSPGNAEVGRTSGKARAEGA